MKNIFYGLILLVLSSCATVGKYENRLKPWIGKTETDLVTVWGIPTSTYPLNDGSKMIMYERNAGTTSTPIGTVYYTETHWCKTTWVIDKSSIIQNYRLEGNNCVSD